MYADFAGLLFLLAMFTGLVWLFSKISRKSNKVTDFFAGLFPVFLIVFVIRTFIAEPYRIPSGSMKPTLVEGDFVLVNKSSYGWYFPVINKRLNWGNEPKRGDVVVFRYPVEPTINFIKRIIGLPGDKILYVDHQLFINGKHVENTYIDSTTIVDTDSATNQPYMVRLFEEDLPTDVKHQIYQRNITGLSFSGTVPEGHYFVMGDNRDSSGDSRVWGFVPDSLMKGKATYILLSINGQTMMPRIGRTGGSID
jgi:signal peptidase I